MMKFKTLIAALILLGGGAAQAAGLEQLLRFQKEIQSARVQFVQTVSSPDGKKQKQNKGQFEFQRPNRFRFDYAAPQNQILIGDGKKVWMVDPDLNQASSRPLDAVLSSTPVALLAGASLGEAFQLKDDGEQGEIAWVAATPKQADQGIQSLRIGLKGRELAALEIVDGLGQRSRLVFSGFEANAKLDAERLRFTPAPGMDVIDGK